MKYEFAPQDLFEVELLNDTARNLALHRMELLMRAEQDRRAQTPHEHAASALGDLVTYTPPGDPELTDEDLHIIEMIKDRTAPVLAEYETAYGDAKAEEQPLDDISFRREVQEAHGRVGIEPITKAVVKRGVTRVTEIPPAERRTFLAEVLAGAV